MSGSGRAASHGRALPLLPTKSETNGVHALNFMCDDIEALIAEMKAHGIACDAVQNQGWGPLTQLTRPGGRKLGVYQPRHARPT